jgi:hypothetical protein
MTISQLFLIAVLGGIVIGALGSSFYYATRIHHWKVRAFDAEIAAAMQRHPAGSDLPDLPPFLLPRQRDNTDW